MPRTSSTLLALAVAAHISAQDTTSATIIVTAQRSDSNLSTETADVQVVEQASMRDRGHPTETVDWFKELPGVGVFSRYGGIDGGVPDIRVRGLDSAYTQVLIDGIPVNNPVSVTNELNFAFLAPAGIRRMELVQGPQSGLYGSRAVAGVAGIQTIRPTRDTQLQASVMGGSFNTWGSSVQATGKATEDLGYAFAVEGLRSDGFSSTTPDLSGDPHEYEADGLDRVSYNARLEYALGSAGSLYVSVLGSRTEQSYDDFYFDANGTMTDPTANDPVAGNDVWTNRLASGGSIVVNDVTLRMDLAWTRTEIDNDTIYGQGYFGGPTPDPTAVAYAGDESFAAMRADWKAMSWCRLLVGVDMQWEQGSQSRTDLGDLWKESQGGAGAYINTRGSWRHASLALSVRGDHRTDVGGHVSGQVGGAVFDEQQVWKLRGSCGNGFRAPSLYERMGVELGFFPYKGNPDLDEETFIGGDVGLEYNPSEDIGASVTWFGTRIADRITYDDVSSPNTRYNDDGQSRVHGIESAVEVNNIAHSGVGIAADYTHQQSRDAKGKDFAYNPSDRGGVRVTARQQSGTRWEFWQSLRLDRTGQYYSNSEERGRVDGYTLLGASVGVAFDQKWEAALRIENLADERYVVTSSSSVAYATMPRSLFLTVSGKF